MNIKEILRRIILPNTYSEEAYLNYLRSRKVLVGHNVKVLFPNHTFIDVAKPYLVSVQF